MEEKDAQASRQLDYLPLLQESTSGLISPNEA
jgi:hypothetical protein